MPSLIDIKSKGCEYDLEEIAKIEKLSFLSPWSPKAFKAEIKKPNSRVWAVVDDDEDTLSGYVCFWMFDSEVQLINIAVHPRKRGRGLGKYMLIKMIEESVSRGIQYIWLEVRPSNSVAKGLYRKLGFEDAGRRPRYYTDTNEDAIVMSLSLTSWEGLRPVSH